jgi:peptidyl-prolyl cis-trans isomerase B (cyclophilin B)
MTRAPIAAFLVAALLLAGCGDKKTKKPVGDTTIAKTADKEKQCQRAELPPTRPDGGQKPPAGPLAADKTYTVTFATSCGTFAIKVDQKVSPRTAASFVSLARSGFYNDTPFHRIVPGFVIQGGDPTGSGNGGPGYTTRDVPPPGTRYTRGVVAMAKTGAEAPGTAGSQFYVVTGADAKLPPDYALLGKQVSGEATTKRINDIGDPNSGGEGTPLQPVVIEKATVSEK